MNPEACGVCDGLKIDLDTYTVKKAFKKNNVRNLML